MGDNIEINPTVNNIFDQGSEISQRLITIIQMNDTLLSQLESIEESLKAALITLEYPSFYNPIFDKRICNPSIDQQITILINYNDYLRQKIHMAEDALYGCIV